MASFLKDEGRGLLANGYRIVPIEPKLKHPNMRGWDAMTMNAGDVSKYPGYGVGILTGVGMNPIVGIDIDAYDDELSARFKAWCLEHLGPAPERVGMAPKVLLVYRASEPEWKKGNSSVFTDLFGNANKLEVLGKGQQFVAYHVHPDTGKPYAWVDDQGGIRKVKADALTTITLEQAVEAVAVFNTMAHDMGLERSASATFVKKAPRECTPREEDDFFGRTNDAALQHLDLWVPALFPTARDYHNGYRVAQTDIGRAHLQEDLSILPEGIRDFGVADMGDAKAGGRTPIDLVMEWSHLTMDDLTILTAFDAAVWLCDQMNTPREELGFGMRRKKDHEAGKDAMRVSLAALKRKVDSAQDVVEVRTDIMGSVRLMLSEYPLLESDVYSIVQARLKALGSTINKAEFGKAIAVASPPTVTRARPMTEFGNTERMLDKFPNDLMFVPETGDWYLWTGGHWQKSVDIQVEHLAKLTIQDLPKEAAEHGDQEGAFFTFCAMSQQLRMVRNMVALAASHPKVVVSARELNKFNHFLGVKNGVVDLRTGELLPPNRDYRITLSTECEYDPAAKCPLFEQTLDQVFFGNTDMMEYFLRTLGYSIMGDPKEDLMFIPVGQGRNGKSTLLGTVRTLLGGYARSADANSFVSDGKPGSAGGAREDILRLNGTRFVYVNEPDEGGELREGAVKAMTGGDAITARGLYSKASIEIVPTWVIHMPTNHKPIIKGTDNGIWLRLVLIPFERNFETDPHIKKDPDLREKLKREMPGVLSLLVRNAIRYQKEGISPPKSVREARDAYRSQSDLLAEWMDECCEVKSSAECFAKDLWISWEMFAKTRGLLNYIKSSTALGRRLDSRFPTKRGAGGARMRLGIALKGSETLF